MDAISAARAEIERRYKRDRAEGEPVSIAALRIAELRRLYRARYGTVLPDDDGGRDDAAIMCHHLAKRPEAERRIAAWLGLWCPWMPPDEVAALIQKVLARPLRWRADKLAKRLGLNAAERARLKIVTIGACDLLKAERTARRKAKARQRDEVRRRTAGAKTRSEYEADSLSRTRPWERLGMSRAGWYRAGKPNA
jgi:hypothetical protein